MDTSVPAEGDRLLSRTQAAALLKAAGRTVELVVRVCDDDAILFVGALKRNWTAWLSRDDQGRRLVQFEQGFSPTFGACSSVSAPIVVPDEPDEPAEPTPSTGDQDWLRRISPPPSSPADGDGRGDN